MSYFAQHGEDEYIRRLFPNKNNGVCIEVGANKKRVLSMLHI